MDVMRGLEESGSSAPLPGVENLMLHFTPYAEDWSKLPVIVSGEGCYVTDDKGNTYIDGLAGSLRRRSGTAGRSWRMRAQADEGARVLPELEFPAPAFARTGAEAGRDSARRSLQYLLRLLWIGGCGDGYQAGTAVSLLHGGGAAPQGDLAQNRVPRDHYGRPLGDGYPVLQGAFRASVAGLHARKQHPAGPRGPPTPSRRP